MQKFMAATGFMAFSLVTAPAAMAQVPSNGPSTTAQQVTETKASVSCLQHLHDFDLQMEKEGYWLSGSGYGFGYPVTGYWLESLDRIGDQKAETSTHITARFGYEVRTLLASANILARKNKDMPCEETLSVGRDAYKSYVSYLKASGVKAVDTSGWRRQQIAASKPAFERTVPLRADELLGAAVLNMDSQALGSIDDIILDPKTSKIAYLVVSSGGLFGLGGTYVPVPWNRFKVTPKMNLLVLDTTMESMKVAPRLEFTLPMPVEPKTQDEKADAFWKTRFEDKN